MDLFKQKFTALTEILESNVVFDAQRASSLLNDLKNVVFTSNFLLVDQTNLSHDQQREFCRVLEYDALLNIRLRNMNKFNCSLLQLKGLYFRKTNPPLISDLTSLLLSLSLIYYLSVDDFVEFNLELPSIISIIQQNDKYLMYALHLYEAISENSISRIISLTQFPPSPYFEQFTSSLLEGARKSYADTIKNSYRHLNVSQLTDILHFDTLQDTKQFIIKNGWIITPDDQVVFLSSFKKSPDIDPAVRSVKLAVNFSLLN